MQARSIDRSQQDARLPDSSRIPPSAALALGRGQPTAGQLDWASQAVCPAAAAAEAAVRGGRPTSRPVQLGHVSTMPVLQVVQKVHSKLQIIAGPSAASGWSHRSQWSRISSIASLDCRICLTWWSRVAVDRS
jgi:hypothetical protein